MDITIPTENPATAMSGADREPMSYNWRSISFVSKGGRQASRRARSPKRPTSPAQASPATTKAPMRSIIHCTPKSQPEFPFGTPGYGNYTPPACATAVLLIMECTRPPETAISSFSRCGKTRNDPSPSNCGDTSPFLGDIGIVFLGVAAWAIPTEAAVHLSAPACWQINVSSADSPPRAASSMKRDVKNKPLPGPWMDLGHARGQPWDRCQAWKQANEACVTNATQNEKRSANWI